MQLKAFLKSSMIVTLMATGTAQISLSCSTIMSVIQRRPPPVRLCLFSRASWI